MWLFPWGRKNTVSRTRLVLTATPEATYVIGDVHGCSSLLSDLLVTIESDAAVRIVDPLIVLVGDIVDRGSETARVIDKLILMKSQGKNVILLAGNHEEEMVSFVDRPTAGAGWLRHGGDATLASYGVDLERVRWSQMRSAISAHVPEEHLDLLRTAPVSIEAPGWFISHAGGRPDLAPANQSDYDLQWFKDGMYSGHSETDKWVVHGHDAGPAARRVGNRINVDSGAYATGVLTAVRLAGQEQPQFLTATLNPTHRPESTTTRF